MEYLLAHGVDASIMNNKVGTMVRVYVYMRDSAQGKTAAMLIEARGGIQWPPSA